MCSLCEHPFGFLRWKERCARADREREWERSWCVCVAFHNANMVIVFAVLAYILYFENIIICVMFDCLPVLLQLYFYFTIFFLSFTVYFFLPTLMRYFSLSTLCLHFFFPLHQMLIIFYPFCCFSRRFCLSAYAVFFVSVFFMHASLWAADFLFYHKSKDYSST